jgi:hypothetical protein
VKVPSVRFGLHSLPYHVHCWIKEEISFVARCLRQSRTLELTMLMYCSDFYSLASLAILLSKDIMQASFDCMDSDHITSRHDLGSTLPFI